MNSPKYSHISKNMAESDATDQDKKRIRTQFTKNERFHLLKIMEEYGSLLEDKNLSVLARKEIWLRVENNFNSGQFLGRTSAQLKKYWQNYKYHSKKTKLLQKSLSPETKHVIKTMGKIDTEEWNQYNNQSGLGVAKSVGISSFKNELEIEPAPKSDDLAKFKASTENSNFDLDIPIKQEFSQKPLDLTFKKQGHGENIKKFVTMCSKNTGNPMTLSHSEHKSEVLVENSGTLINRNSSFDAADVTPHPEKFDILVSDTEVTGNKVTVSVICPSRETQGPFKRKFKSSSNDSISQAESKKNKNLIKLEPNSQDENSGVMKMNVLEDLECPVYKSANESEEGKAIKNVCINTNVIFGPKDKNKSGSINKISRKPCLVLKEKNNIDSARVNEVVDKDLKANPFSRVECSSILNEPINKDSENQIATLNDSNNSVSLFGSLGVNELVEEGKNDSEIKMEEVRGSGVFGPSEDPSSDLFIKFEWDHRLLLRQLETQEMLLKLKIAEMAIQETRLRIRAMDEERNRAKELHDLRLARISEENS